MGAAVIQDICQDSVERWENLPPRVKLWLALVFGPAAIPDINALVRNVAKFADAMLLGSSDVIMLVLVFGLSLFYKALRK